MNVRRTAGIVRSLAMYYGQFWKAGRLRRFYGQFLAPGDLAFDIGAHVGNRVRAWRGLGAKVVAVEPQPDFVQILRTLYGQDPHVIIAPVGVGARAERRTLHVNRAAPTVSTFSDQFITDVAEAPRWAGVVWDDAVEVELVTLDDLIAEHGVPAFCKVDVEGLEAVVLEGLHRALPALSFEYVPEVADVAIACIDRLETLGSYQYRRSQGETMRWEEPAWVGPDEMRRTLSGLTPAAGSGDVYAQRG